MNQGDNQLQPESAPGFAYEVPPVPHVAMSAGAQPQYATQPVSDRARSGKASLIIGGAGVLLPLVLGVVLGPSVFFLALVTMLPVGIVAIVSGHRSLGYARSKGTNTGTPIAGMVVGYTLTAFSFATVAIVGFVLFVTAVWSSGV